jgi:hypothetical protein
VTKHNIEEYEIKFIDEGHEYFVNGEKVPCISDINKVILLSSFKDIPEYILKNAALRGDIVHKIIQMDLTFGLDESSVDEKIKGFYESYKLFKEDNHLEPKMVEMKFYCPSLNYCFTLDYKGKCNNLNSLIDWKTGSVYDEVKYRAQVGGQYNGLLDYFEDDLEQVGVVQLYKNGKRGKGIWYNKEQALFDWKSIKRVYDMRGGK